MLHVKNLHTTNCKNISHRQCLVKFKKTVFVCVYVAEILLCPNTPVYCLHVLSGQFTWKTRKEVEWLHFV